jgi:hypothetical protein
MSTTSTDPTLIEDVKRRINLFLVSRIVDEDEPELRSPRGNPRFFGSEVLENVKLVSVELKGVHRDENGDIRVEKGAESKVVTEYTVGPGQAGEKKEQLHARMLTTFSLSEAGNFNKVMQCVVDCNSGTSLLFSCSEHSGGASAYLLDMWVDC